MNKIKSNIEIVVGALVLLSIVLLFQFSNKYVSGESEIKWAIDGVIYTNYTLMMFTLLALSGGLVAWMVYKYAKRMRLPISIISAIITAMVMTMHEFFFWAMPIIIISIFASLKLGILDRIKNRRDRHENIDNRK